VDGLVAIVPLAAATAPYLAHERAGAPSVDVPGRALAPDHAGRGGARALLHGRHGGVHLGTDVPRPAWSTRPPTWSRLATFPYLLTSGLVRLAGDDLVHRFGAVRVLRTGALVASAALALIVFAPTWPVAVLGFFILGGGVAVVAPLSFSAAARIAGGDTLDPAERRGRVDAVIARFNQFNYVGALLGAVMTGWSAPVRSGSGSRCRWCSCSDCCRWRRRSLQAHPSRPPGADRLAPCEQPCWGPGSWGRRWPDRSPAKDTKVAVWNRTRARADEAAGESITAYGSVREAVSGADLVITALFDADNVIAVADDVVAALGRDGRLAAGQHRRPRRHGPDRPRAAAVGDRLLDAPVLGTRKPAEDGTLVVLLSGPAAARDRVRWALDAIGSRTQVVGTRSARPAR
jgi:hypothetical protein